MKYIIVIILISVSALYANAQNANWIQLEQTTTNIGYFNIGYDFGLTAQIGYARRWKQGHPLWLLLDYSTPMGADISDDFKLRTGGQITVYRHRRLMINTRLLANFRSYRNDLVHMSSFGSELALSLGHYGNRWHIEGELGFNKSIITHLRHTDQMKEQYNQIHDGWYLPTGGHWFYGIQVGKRLGQESWLSFKFGVTDAEGEDMDPLLPRYVQIGYTKSF